ncbi:GNAT family N-acetyltransferase [Actinomyces sp. F1_1611]
MLIRRVDAEELRQAVSGAAFVPLEQATPWRKFSEANGHYLWGHLLWEEDGKVLAAATFYRYEVRGQKYLWTRNGPLWLKAPAPAREEEALDLLRTHLRQHAKPYSFVRLHAWYEHPALHRPFRVIGYDRTVLIDGARGNREQAFQLLPTAGRRLIKKARRRLEEHSGTIVEATGLSREEFTEYYRIMEETGSRDGFTPHEFDYYWAMLQKLGPEHARLFALKLDGKLAGWDLVGVYGKRATAFYGATNAAARSSQTAPLLDFEVACLLGEEGIEGLDLMGIHSPRTPQLYDVGRYKLQFAQRYVDVPGLWDLPLSEPMYRTLELAYRTRTVYRRLTGRVRGQRGDD